MSGRCTTIRVSHRSSWNVGHEESATAKETRKLRRRRRPRSAHGGAQCAQDRADVRHADLRLGERKGRRQEAVTGSRERRPALSGDLRDPFQLVVPMPPRSLLRTWPAKVACRMWPRCCEDRLSDSCRCTLWNRKVSTRSRLRWQTCCQSGSACPSRIPSCNRILWVTQGRAGFSDSQTKPSSLVKWRAAIGTFWYTISSGRAGPLQTSLGTSKAKAVRLSPLLS